MFTYPRGWWALLIAAYMLVSCSTAQQFQETQEDATKAAVAIQKEFGGKVSVNWTMDGETISSVEVVFSEQPKEMQEDIWAFMDHLRKIVDENFRRRVSKVEVSY